MADDPIKSTVLAMEVYIANRIGFSYSNSKVTFHKVDSIVMYLCAIELKTLGTSCSR